MDSAIGNPREEALGAAIAPQPPIFYIVDWLPPEFGAVGQYALIAARQIAAGGRHVHLIGLTRGPPSIATEFVGGGRLDIHRLQARPYMKTRLFRRLCWSIATNLHLVRTALRHPQSHGAEIVFTGAPPFMVHFAIALKFFRKAHLTYRITDFYPEALIAHRGRRTLALALAERITWFVRRRVDRFEVLGEDQRALLLRGGIDAARIEIKRDTAPVVVTGDEQPAPVPPALGGCKILLYSGNYGIAHEVETVVRGLALHHRDGSGRFGLWLNSTGSNADRVAWELTAQGIPLAQTPPVDLAAFPALLAAADAHLVSLRTEFAGVVLPSKIYACLQSRRPIVFVGPAESDVHLLCTAAGIRYFRITPGDAAGFARALDALADTL